RSGGKIASTLKGLKSHDPGPEVDLVIGLIDAPKRHEVEMGKLVRVDTLGRHLVLRSFNRQAEADALAIETLGLSEDAQDELLAARRRHKQSIVLAHGIAVFFGAVGQGPEYIDAERYSTSQMRLSEAAARVIAITSAAHLSEGNRAEAWARVKQELTTLGARAELLAAIDIREKRDANESKGDGRTAIRSEDKSRILSTKGLIASGKLDEAWETLEPLIERYPQEATVVELGCIVSASRKAKDALAHCNLAATLNKANPDIWIALGRIRAESSPKLARENFRQAELLLETMDKGAATGLWMQLARAYRDMSMPTRARKAAVMGVGGESGLAKISAVEKWATQMRVRYGVGIGMSESEESDYLRNIRSGLQLVYKQDYAKATKVQANLARKFPNAIGASLLKCEVQLRQRRYAKAGHACQLVLAKQPANAWATYLLGVLDVRQARVAYGISKLEDAIARDPQLKAAYQALATVYRKSGDKRLESLGARYKVQFDSTMP
ncbi:MAG: hypothetical protein JKY56_06955, partial [Kofleriaceae bacterium]|nr:hypothetical protein [Kofleriaceae bacterium]